MSHSPPDSTTRRRLLQVSSLALAGITGHTLAQTAAAPAPLTIAIIGDGRTGSWASLRAGANGRTLESELGTKVIWQPGFTASLPVMEAIKAGGVDFTFATATAVVNAVGAGVPIVPLAAFALPVNTVDLLVRSDSTIRSAADLKGKKIAHQNGTTGTYSLIKYLETAGLRLSDVQAVSLSGADAYTAFAQGSVEAWIHWQHAASLAQARLGDKVRTLPKVKTYDYAFYVARAEVAEKHPKTVAKLVRVIRDTQIYINQHPAETVALWSSLGGFDINSAERRVFEKLVTDVRLSESTATTLRPVDAAAAAATQDLADNFHALGVLPRRIDVRSFLLSPKFDPIKRIVAAELAGV
ncbi:ABC transporter substrate-binding protein [Polaromonas sp. SM01]|uniref:ABC transporter substrate-binding protein n=1 Tax=Polaromonas sp. SM01 TaxID=3085630 RepID=UPI0029810708|nr:ABC transporter substrate-binding protein [Polaromonas sp. SM01]MDW5443664.1 ABC transporter substrate-binding protein [Polaromonas sp. SM01]